MTRRDVPRVSRIGVPLLWIGTCISQLLLLGIFAKELYYQTRLLSPAENTVLTALAFALFSALAHPYSSGRIDTEGIHYRRYGPLKKLTWDSIELISWTGPRIEVTFKRKSFLDRTLLFWLNPLRAVRDYSAQQSGTDPDPPEVLNRIAALQVEYPPKIQLGPLVSPGISNAIILGFGAAVCIAAAGLVVRLLNFVAHF